MLVKGSIDTIYEVLIFVVGVLILFLLMFNFANWLESLKPKQKKEKVKKEIVKETIKKVTEKEEVNSNKLQTSEENNISSKNVANNECPFYSDNASQDNYLYDRFVISPTKADCPISNKIYNGFLSEDETNSIRDRKINIKVKEVEDLSEAKGKEYLYNRIYQMANENQEKKEKLLNDFDKLPREIKLILIENIMQKM